MMELNFSPFPALRSERLLLRQLEDSDAEALFLLRSDERVMQFIDRPRAKHIDDTRQFISMIRDQQENNMAILWGLCLHDDHRLIGNIGYWNILKEHYRGELGYVLHPDFHRKGIMKEAMAQVLDYSFKQMQLHTIMANVNPENIASIKLLQHHGFIQEAYFREDYFFEGKFLDSMIFSLLNPFDGNGGQRINKR